MKTLLTPVVLLLLSACSLFSTPNVQPVVDGVQAMDLKFNELRAGMQKLLNYAQNNGMPLPTYQLYMEFVAERMDDHSRVRTATLAACADLGEVTLGEVFAASESSTARIKELIDSLKTSKEQ